MKTARLTIATNFTPALSFDPTSSGERGRFGTAVLKLLQPSVTVDLPIVGTKNFAPQGQPSGYGIAVLAVVAALALYGAYKIVRG